MSDFNNDEFINQILKGSVEEKTGHLPEIANGLPKWETKTSEEIVKDSEQIDPAKVSDEILTWLANNVENFIDNQEKIYRIDILLDETPVDELIDIANIKALQNLYRALPDINGEDEEPDPNFESIEKTNEARDCLDLITFNVLEDMKNNTSKLNELFNRMKYYYELRAVCRGELIEDQIEGSIDILDFKYDNFSVNVGIKDTVANEIVKEYIIPDAFSILFEIGYRREEAPLSLF